MTEGEDPGFVCCDEAGGRLTYARQVSMPLNGRVQGIDWCIHRIVAALNAGGVGTAASCCGHRSMPGRIDLADGRVLILAASPETAQAVWQALEQK